MPLRRTQEQPEEKDDRRRHSERSRRCQGHGLRLHVRTPPMPSIPRVPRPCVASASASTSGFASKQPLSRPIQARLARFPLLLTPAPPDASPLRSGSHAQLASFINAGDAARHTPQSRSHGFRHTSPRPHSLSLPPPPPVQLQQLATAAMARLATILSFGDHAEEGAGEAFPEPQEDYREGEHDEDDDDAASDASGDSFEFAFARPLAPAEGEHPAEALADDLFAHGRILPAYPVFHRRQAHEASATSATAPPSPDTYCAWAPRSAPGSPAREPAAAFPKSASTGTGEAARRFRLRDILGSGGRSHSDGKEKFLFLQATPAAKPKSRTSALSTPSAPAAKKTHAQQKQSKKKGAAAAAPTEMDMATAHRLFYSKPGAAAGPGGDRTTTNTKTSYLPYRPAIVGFFATAHALRPKHHPY